MAKIKRGNARASRLAPAAKHLFTDASYLPQRGIASWGAMLIDGLNSRLRGGLVHERLTNSTQVEAHAARLALERFMREGWIIPGDTIILHSDNQGVCLQLHENPIEQPKDRLFREQVDLCRAIADAGEIVLMARWIRAHQGEDVECWRSLINQRVDRHARSLMKAENKRRIDAGDIGRLKGSER